MAAVKVDDRTSESALPGGIRVMTMHRAKGLDYRAVAVRDASLRSGGARRHMVDDRQIFVCGSISCTPPRLLPASGYSSADGPGQIRARLGDNGVMSTIFTKIIEGEIPGRFVWADEVCVAFATIEPHTDGHVLVVPRVEVDSYVDAPDDVVAHLAVVAKRIGAAQVRVFEAPRAGLVVAGYGVDHLHLHVLPIRSEEDLSFSSARHPEGPELDAAMERLRGGLVEDGWGEFVPARLDSAALA